MHLSTTLIRSLRNGYTRRYVSTSTTVQKRICIVGAGPAGFYAAQYILKHLENSEIDIVEKLPVPFGLVRFGVAPDHPEVKNVINTFTKTAENPRVRFLGNLSLGKDFTLAELRERYHAVLLTYGADKDRTLNIPNETLRNVLSAREFVAWYNGLPGFENFNPDLSGSTLTLLGQGNVAIDVARIVLSNVDELKKTDITEFALEALSRSKIKKVLLVGRRGPLQVAYTIKELRELLKLPSCSTIWRPNDFRGVQEAVPKLARPRKRITELMLKSLSEQSKQPNSSGIFQPVFFRSPTKINGDDCVQSVEYAVNRLEDDRAIPTDEMETIQTDLVCRSIGYMSTNVDQELNFDNRKGCVRNVSGRVLKRTSTGCDENVADVEGNFENGLYSSGWLATGPTGVILTTMNNSFGVADVICKDFQNNIIRANENRSGLDLRGKRTVSWAGWKAIDEEEIRRGTEKGKLKEKIVNVDEMLKIADGK
ncbi:NADPH:adrenodoxin oxidoreductase, mitochondrial [Toxorhynchites rutilus septentrionalis]|uniref:NADPH:adrenodoxin oxidoreductase, mitochondrial n=1 Tax=Toxorhynchites rutilus septentrionalis TaxID=329112 RepID=UPI00247A5F95|nr:NADPH:adrenodoxin oxidoreductase, mitochondrial [Toxorhynchites rutilus septentrionalis]